MANSDSRRWPGLTPAPAKTRPISRESGPAPAEVWGRRTAVAGCPRRGRAGRRRSSVSMVLVPVATVYQFMWEYTRAENPPSAGLEDPGAVAGGGAPRPRHAPQQPGQSVSGPRSICPSLITDLTRRTPSSSRASIDSAPSRAEHDRRSALRADRTPTVVTMDLSALDEKGHDASHSRDTDSKLLGKTPSTVEFRRTRKKESADGVDGGIRRARHHVSTVGSGEAEERNASPTSTVSRPEC